MNSIANFIVIVLLWFILYMDLMAILAMYTELEFVSANFISTFITSMVVIKLSKD